VVVTCYIAGVDVEWPLMKVIITFTFCCDNQWKSKFMALGNSEFFSPTLHHTWRHDPQTTGSRRSEPPSSWVVSLCTPLWCNLTRRRVELCHYKRGFKKSQYHRRSWCMLYSAHVCIQWVVFGLFFDSWFLVVDVIGIVQLATLDITSVVVVVQVV